MISIATNMSAFNVQRQMNLITSGRSKSTEKLSSGYKINRAADDAAGLTISEKMRSQIRGLNQGMDNIQDGISTCQVMDGALAETQQIMQRMTELSIKAANGTLTPEDRSAIEQEIKQLKLELNRTTESTTFNTKQLLSAVDIDTSKPKIDSGKADIVFAIDNTGSMGGPIGNVKNNIKKFADGLSECDVRFGVLSYGDVRYSDGQLQISSFTDSATQAKADVESIVMSGGGDGPESSLEGIVGVLDNYTFRDDAVKKIILVTDANYHDKSTGGSSLTADEVKKKMDAKGVSMEVVSNTGYSSIYSKLTSKPILDIYGNFSDSLTKIAKEISEEAGEKYHKNPEDIIIQLSGVVGNEAIVHTYDISTDTLGLTDISLATQEGARNAIGEIEKALGKISEYRSQIGADQNMLEHAYNINANTSENTQNAESGIRDTDMAKEMVNNVKYNILSQSTTSMLKQANDNRQSILSLLQ